MVDELVIFIQLLLLAREKFVNPEVTLMDILDVISVVPHSSLEIAISTVVGLMNFIR